jgi:glycosyltransferase involved in cell wall biosynthesis
VIARDVLVVVPARDEEGTVGSVVRRARNLGLDVVVIDDASSDRTAERAREAGAVVLSAPFNLGAWTATQTGIRYALARGYARVVTLDADGQHDPDDIPRVLNRYEGSAKPNVVIASFPARGSRLRHVAWGLLRAVGLLEIDDLTSGFRCYDLASIRLLASKPATLLEFQDVGVLLLLRENGLRVEEVPVPMKARSTGKSRIFRSWANVLYYMAYSLMLCVSKAPAKRHSKLVG